MCCCVLGAGMCRVNTGDYAAHSGGGYKELEK